MPVKMVSMAITRSEKEDAARPMTEGQPMEKMVDYPYGLTIRLETDDLKKLGFNRGQLDPGKRVQGQFMAVITAAGANIVNGLAMHNATLQIQELGLEPEAEDDGRANTMFGTGVSNAGKV